MAKGYWVGRVDVHDDDAYASYLAENRMAFEKYGARFVVRGGRFENPEGTARARNVVIEFPSYEAALACHASPEYQAAKAHRDGHCTNDLIIIEGFEG